MINNRIIFQDPDMYMKSMICLAAAVTLWLGTPALAVAETVTDLDPLTGAALDAAISGAHRTPESKARDICRHPKETLAFFGFRPDMWYAGI